MADFSFMLDNFFWSWLRVPGIDLGMVATWAGGGDFGGHGTLAAAGHRIFESNSSFHVK